MANRYIGREKEVKRISLQINEEKLFRLKKDLHLHVEKTIEDGGKRNVERHI